jgi:hypothetical protein
MPTRNNAGSRGAGRSAVSPRRIKRRAVALILPLAALFLALAAQPALAGLQAEFAPFSDCPVNNPEVGTCIVSETTSGQFTLGNKTVPVNKQIILQGGLAPGSAVLIPAADGNTLSKTALQVPGGIIGIEVLGPLTEVSATAELAGPVEVNIPNAEKGEGVAAVLPVKVKLDNLLLGPACFIGSSFQHATLNLTTGTTNPPGPNKPISGSPGTAQIVGQGKIIRAEGSSLVDNAFSVPGAQGCGGLLQLLVDPGVDLIVGVPAAGGRNTAILNGTLAAAGAPSVRAVRTLPELGRCVKVPSEAKVFHGKYVDAGCVEENVLKTGKFEWEPGPGASKTFSGTGAAASLETTGKALIKCTASHSEGEYTGTKTATAKVVLSGCSLGGESCQSTGSAAGEVATSSLAAHLGFIADNTTGGELHLALGWDLANEPSIVSAECGGSKESVLITGSVIGAISAVDKMTASYALKFAAAGGAQSPASFEEGPNDTLSAKIGGGATEAIGLKATSKITNGEKLEFKGRYEE